MKTFIKKILFFLFPIVLLSYFLDVFISNNLKKSNQFAKKEFSTWNAIFEGKINSDFLIYGNSRAWVHFNATMMTDSLFVPTYNLGINGHGFWLQYFRHSLLLIKNPKPKIIIVAIDEFCLEKRKDLYNSEQFLPYMLWNAAIKKTTNSYEGFVSMDFELPLIRYYGKTEALETAFCSFFGNLNNPVQRVRGYQGQIRIWNKDLKKAKSTIKKYEVKVDLPTLVLFEKFIVECKSQNIKLIFVNAPEYIEGQKFVRNRAEVLAIYTKLSKQYRIPLYDYSNDTISFQKKYFYNSVHMNKTGADLFTTKLIDTIKHDKVMQSILN